MTGTPLEYKTPCSSKSIFSEEGIAAELIKFFNCFDYCGCSEI